MINVPIVTAPATHANKSLLEVLNLAEWNPTTIAALQEETRNRNNYQVQCGSQSGVSVGYPEIEQVYGPEDPCLPLEATTPDPDNSGGTISNVFPG
jgi:hypothetical protein